jgi:hypothetical protein
MYFFPVVLAHFFARQSGQKNRALRSNSSDLPMQILWDFRYNPLRGPGRATILLRKIVTSPLRAKGLPKDGCCGKQAGNFRSPYHVLGLKPSGISIFTVSPDCTIT